MKRYLIFYCYFVAIFTVSAQTPSSDRNYIMETLVRDSGITTLTQLNALPVQGANRTIQYFDGLGRPLQTIQWQGSPGKKDIVQHIEYDGFGRESQRYLPYAEQTSSDGSYRSSAKASQSDYYKGTGWDSHVKKTEHPYAVTVFENSPLDRVLEQGSPGGVWQPAAGRTPNTGRTVVMDYGTNSEDDVRVWRVNAAGNAAGGKTYYAPGRLYRTVIRNENWVSGKVGTVEEYRDFEGRVVLKRVWETESKKLETQYVYDDFGDLCYVIPPAVTVDTLTAISGDVDFWNYVYAYRYDGRRRLADRKVPGRGWEHIVYNRNDLPILTQDAVQRAAGQWNYTKYDAFGRVTETGIHTAGYADQSAAQAAADSHAGTTARYWEERVGTASYTNQSFPTTGLVAHVIHYYDDYAFDGANTASLQPSGISVSTKTKTLLTGTKVTKDDGSGPLLTVHYYDDRARLIQSVSQNHLGGTDYVTNTYSFVGELLTSRHEHRDSPSGAVTIVLTTNEYDHVGRLAAVKHKVNAQDTVVLAKYEYNEIGQLRRKSLHSEDGGTSFIDTVGYRYNERGWATRIGSPHFTQELRYHDGTVPQYNGNISQQVWGHSSTTNSTFSYTYDHLNRLLEGTSTGTVMSELLEYDDMGNITKLTRDNGTAVSYAYTGNRLASLSGGLTGSYTYDANGNATHDRTGMAFSYNHLNLPKTATKSGTSVTYLYDATGSKLRKTATVGSTTTQRDYIGGIEYSKVGSGASTIEMIHTEEGYLQRNASNNTYTYHYNLTDHLGNVRATLQRTGPTTGNVIQKHDYYPFGKSKALVTSGINRYLYNGKEIQDEIGGHYDYGARFYDAEIGRWNTVDPLAEGRPEMTPYHFVSNNPINRIDPDGRWDDWVQNADGEIYWDKNANSQATTKAGETYLGKTLTFEFNSYIDGANWDGPNPLIGPSPVGDKLTSTINVTGIENEAGELTGINATKQITIGETPWGKARDSYPGLGDGQNKFSFSKSMNADGTLGSYNLNFEQHASVSKIEEIGMQGMGYNIVNVAQKLNLNYSGGDLSISSYTDVFPSATLKMNGTQMMYYKQPSFKATHSLPIRGYTPPSMREGTTGGRPIYDYSYKPAMWYRR